MDCNTLHATHRFTKTGHLMFVVYDIQTLLALNLCFKLKFFSLIARRKALRICDICGARTQCRLCVTTFYDFTIHISRNL
jgi:hypothetical protein